MVTNYPQLTATGMNTHNDETLVNRAMVRVNQFFCGLRGHDAVLHFEGKRVNMRCTSCGHDMPGWEVSGRGPQTRYAGDARRHAMVRPQLVLRKTA